MTFSRALVRGSKLKLWKTKPILRLRTSARCSGLSVEISSRSSQYLPEEGRSRQPRMFIRVVLPEPEAPMSATISPLAMVNDTPLSTGTSTSPRWYVLQMSCKVMSSMCHLVLSGLLRQGGLGHVLQGSPRRVAAEECVQMASPGREQALQLVLLGGVQSGE